MDWSIPPCMNGFMGRNWVAAWPQLNAWFALLLFCTFIVLTPFVSSAPPTHCLRVGLARLAEV